jgi:hypothetical protein
MYLSDDSNVRTLLQEAGLALDELEVVVGRFPLDHHNWPGKLKGEVVYKMSGEIIIRHHFTKKVLWRGESVG